MKKRFEGDPDRYQRMLARGEAVLVQGTGFRCLAYRTADWKWRNYFNDEELPGEVREVQFDTARPTL